MKGKPLKEVYSRIISSCCNDPDTLEYAYFSLITVGSSINQVFPLTSLIELNPFLPISQLDTERANTQGLNEYMAFRFIRDHLNAQDCWTPPKVLWLSDRSHVKFETHKNERYELWDRISNSPLKFIIIDCSKEIIDYHYLVRELGFTTIIIHKTAEEFIIHQIEL